jgi:hypothetical protein
MKHKDYLIAKDYLAYFNRLLKGINDKPYVRQELNDITNDLKKDIRRINSLSEKRKNLYCNWLQNYCCSLYP